MKQALISRLNKIKPQRKANKVITILYPNKAHTNGLQSALFRTNGNYYNQSELNDYIEKLRIDYNLITIRLHHSGKEIIDDNNVLGI